MLYILIHVKLCRDKKGIIHTERKAVKAGQERLLFYRVCRCHECLTLHLEKHHPFSKGHI